MGVREGQEHSFTTVLTRTVLNIEVSDLGVIILPVLWSMSVCAEVYTSMGVGMSYYTAVNIS